MRVIHPSMRSKLLQNAFCGLTASKSAKNIHTTKATSTTEIHDHRGLYFLSATASTTHPAKAISTIIRKKNAFPVINGKKKLLAIKIGVSGNKKSAPRVTHLAICFAVPPLSSMIEELYHFKYYEYKLLCVSIFINNTMPSSTCS